MNRKLIFLITCIILSLFFIGSVSAIDNNSSIQANESSSDFEPEPDVPDISLSSLDVYTSRSAEIHLKDSNNTPISNKNLTAKINNKNYYLLTNNKGTASLKLNLKPNSYILDVSFTGDNNYSSVKKTFKINVLKLDSEVVPVSTTVLKYKYFYFYLKDNFGNPIKNKAITIKANGNTYKTTTNDYGKAGLKINFNPNKEYGLKISFAGNNYYNAISKTVKLVVPATTSIVVGNDKLLSNGYLRIYLKSSTLSAVSNKTVVITVGNTTFIKTTNAEGVIVFAPKLGEGNFTVNAVFDGTKKVLGCANSKNVTGIIGDVIDPLKFKIPLIKGVPDIDVMPGHYIMADGDMQYTLLKAQYRETIKRDSYYLYLYNKMSKYVYFKTKYSSQQHILVREKWNVIERAINTKIVKSHQYDYWPSEITVALKGKSYTYSQVRDEQNTGYTCGPTSCSMCSQFLKNYVSEKKFTKLAKTTVAYGSDTKLLKKALEKVNFRCSYFYKSKFNKAINELKKGGCCLVFNTWHHYIAILDVSKDGKKVLVGNPSGDYDHGSHGIPTKWVTVKFIKTKFNNYNPYGIVVKLKYSLKSVTKTQLKNSYSSFGAGWTAQNTNERIPQIGK